MTSLRYRRALLLRALGYNPNLKRLGEASTEMHLLQDAEEILGSFCWEDCEKIEALHEEYWALKSLQKKRDRLIKNIEQADHSLQDSHKNRQADLSNNQEGILSLEKKRDALLAKEPQLKNQHQELLRKAARIRKKYNSLKSKLSFLKEEADPSARQELEKTSQTLQSLHNKYQPLKKREQASLVSHQKLKQELSNLMETLDQKRANLQSKASQAYQNIGQTNRTLSENRHTLGFVHQEIASLLRKVGIHLSQDRSPDCRKVTQNHRKMVRQMRALRQSIQWNHALVTQ